MRTNHYILGVSILIPFILGSGAMAQPEGEKGAAESQHLGGERVVLGHVVEVRSGQARIDMGTGQDRFVPMGVRKDKRLPDLKEGDLVEITVNDQNLIVDVHLPGEVSRHRIVSGKLAGPLETGHETAVIKTPDGKEESHRIRPVARSKVASIPVGADAIFLIDELNKIVDVTFASAEAARRAAEDGQLKSPLKGNLNRVVGSIVETLKGDKIAIRAQDGTVSSYEVRPFAQPRLHTLDKEDLVVLLVDDEGKVTDVAIPPSSR